MDTRRRHGEPRRQPGRGATANPQGRRADTAAALGDRACHPRRQGGGVQPGRKRARGSSEGEAHAYRTLQPSLQDARGGFTRRAPARARPGPRRARRALPTPSVPPGALGCHCCVPPPQCSRAGPRSPGPSPPSCAGPLPTAPAVRRPAWTLAQPSPSCRVSLQNAPACCSGSARRARPLDTEAWRPRPTGSVHRRAYRSTGHVLTPSAGHAPMEVPRGWPASTTSPLPPRPP